MAKKPDKPMLGAQGQDSHAPFLQDIRNAADQETPLLDYASWLASRDDGARSEFVRLLVELRRPAMCQEELLRRITIRARMRTLRIGMAGDWLSAVGDPGLVGEILVSASTLTGRDADFWIVSRVTTKLAMLRGIESIVVDGRMRPGGDWKVMPVVPSDEEIRQTPGRGREFRTKMAICPGGGVSFCGGGVSSVFWDGTPERCYHND